MNKCHIAFDTCIIALLLLVISSCSHTPPIVDPDHLCPPDVSHDKLLMGEGCWFDGDSYRVSTTAAPSKKSAVIDEQKTSAKLNAILMARAIFLNVINDKRLELISRGSPPGVHVNFTDNNYPAKVFSSVAKNGTILWESYDEMQNCSIIYEIHERGLRKKVADYLNKYK